MSEKIFVRLLIVLYFFAGLSIFSHYGISWDENAQRINNGLVNFNYLFENQKQELIKSPEKYHGPAFELVLFSVERFFNITDNRTIYLMRHLLTFLVFYISSVCIYLLSLQLFKKEKWALFTFLLYILSPRIFAEAFYNCKDIAFLSLFTISLLTFYLFTLKPNLKFMLLHAAVSGFMIDIRVTGILIPVITTLFLISDFIINRAASRYNRFILIVLLYLVFQVVFIILFWPILWENPIFHFMEALKEMSRFPWKSEIRYLGEIIYSIELSWHYVPVWILISTPVIFTLLFVFGTLFLFARLISLKKGEWYALRYETIILLCFILPLASVIVLHSIVYDGWRHLYFLHAPFVIIATRGAFQVCNGVAFLNNNKLFSAVAYAMVFICPILTIIKDHPHQNVYFNSVALKLFNPAEKYFEMDYWGLSYRKGLEYVLSVDSSETVKVHAESKPGKFNKQIIDKRDYKRLDFIDNVYEPGIYYLADFRGTVLPIDTTYFPLIHTIETTSGILLRIYRRAPEKLYKPDTLFIRKLNFEENENLNTLSDATYYSGKSSKKTDSLNQYCEVLKIEADSSMEKSKISIQIEAWINSSVVNPSLVFVSSVDRGTQNIIWKGESLQGQINEQNKWVEFSFNPSLSDTLRMNDVISIYFWNNGKHPIYFDNVEISLVKYKPF